MILKDLIELDTYGYSDHSIELSSDEEEAPGDGVSELSIREEQQRLCKAGAVNLDHLDQDNPDND